MKQLLWQIFLLVILISILFIFSYLGFFPAKHSVAPQQSTEVSEIIASSDISVQAKLYRELIERVGPIEAQEELFHSGLPFTGETHLLNHTVGDYLYEKYGQQGIKYCKEYFLSSCYHGFILNAIADGGLSEVTKVFNLCLESGVSVYTQCAHGIGHGLLVNAGYKNLTKALHDCDEIKNKSSEFPTFNCYDGVFMENIWAVHDGAPSPDRWVKESDIFYPCDDKRIDDKYLLGCWSNQPSLVYQFFNGDIKRVADKLCLKVEATDLKEKCFDGLARQIHPLTEGKVDKTLELCGLMPDSNWRNYCISINAVSSFSVGDRSSPFTVCAAIEDSAKPDCYGRLLSIMRAYAGSKKEFQSWCPLFKETFWQKECQKISLNF